jgi:hypothetical protein
MGVTKKADTYRKLQLGWGRNFSCIDLARPWHSATTSQKVM